MHLNEIDGGADEKSLELHLFDAGVELMMPKKKYLGDSDSRFLMYIKIYEYCHLLAWTFVCVF